MKIKLNKGYAKLVLPYILVTTTIYSSRYLITDKLPLIRNYEKVNTKNVLILGEKTSGENSLGKQSLGEQSLSEQSLSEQSLGKQSLGDPSLGESTIQGTYYETTDKNPNQVRLFTKCIPYNNKYKLQGYLYTFNKYNEEELLTALKTHDETYIKEMLGPPKEIEREVPEKIQTPYIEGIIFKNSNIPTLIKESLTDTILDNTFIIASSLVGTRMIGEVIYLIKERKEYKKTPKN